MRQILVKYFYLGIVNSQYSGLSMILNSKNCLFLIILRVCSIPATISLSTVNSAHSSQSHQNHCWPLCSIDDWFPCWCCTSCVRFILPTASQILWSTPQLVFPRFSDISLLPDILLEDWVCISAQCQKTQFPNWCEHRVGTFGALFTFPFLSFHPHRELHSRLR